MWWSSYITSLGIIPIAIQLPQSMIILVFSLFQRASQFYYGTLFNAIQLPQSTIMLIFLLSQRYSKSYFGRLLNAIQLSQLVILSILYVSSLSRLFNDVPSFLERVSTWCYRYGSLRGLRPKGIYGDFFTYGFSLSGTFYYIHFINYGLINDSLYKLINYGLINILSYCISFIIIRHRFVYLIKCKTICKCLVT